MCLSHSPALCLKGHLKTAALRKWVVYARRHVSGQECMNISSYVPLTQPPSLMADIFVFI